MAGPSIEAPRAAPPGGYKTVMLRDVMQRLTEIETLAMPNN
jgi:hypothetical protein